MGVGGGVPAHQRAPHRQSLAKIPPLGARPAFGRLYHQASGRHDVGVPATIGSRHVAPQNYSTDQTPQI